MAAPGGQVCVEEPRSWVDAAPVSFTGTCDCRVVRDVLPFTQGLAPSPIRNKRPKVNPLEKTATGFFDAVGMPMTVAFEDQDGLFVESSKTFHWQATSPSPRADSRRPAAGPRGRRRRRWCLVAPFVGIRWRLTGD